MTAGMDDDFTLFSERFLLFLLPFLFLQKSFCFRGNSLIDFKSVNGAGMLLQEKESILALAQSSINEQGLRMNDVL